MSSRVLLPAVVMKANLRCSPSALCLMSRGPLRCQPASSSNAAAFWGRIGTSWYARIINAIKGIRLSMCDRLVAAKQDLANRFPVDGVHQGALHSGDSAEQEHPN